MADGDTTCSSSAAYVWGILFILVLVLLILLYFNVIPTSTKPINVNVTTSGAGTGPPNAIVTTPSGQNLAVSPVMGPANATNIPVNIPAVATPVTTPLTTPLTTPSGTTVIPAGTIDHFGHSGGGHGSSGGRGGSAGRSMGGSRGGFNRGSIGGAGIRRGSIGGIGGIHQEGVMEVDMEIMGEVMVMDMEVMEETITIIPIMDQTGTITAMTCTQVLIPLLIHLQE